MIQPIVRPFEIALDIGHSSIGWAIFKNGEKFDLLGTGVVLFPADDCLAIKRRAYRRQRRHVRATRQRIERLKKLLLHVGALSEGELNQPGCAWPWKLAAEVLSGSGRVLTWPELWDVLRWYAHNRGYDGNARWSKQEANPEDTDKEKEANGLMQEYGKTTMAETFCAVLGINALGLKKSSRERFKGLNAAFPREGVFLEVKSILEKLVNVLPKLTADLVRTLVSNDDYATREWDNGAWKIVLVPEVEAHLPKRYKGSYLFGQSIPRFDNRIISSCPITYARIFNEVFAATGDKEKARHQAMRDSKVPTKKCPEFLRYRWMMILANIRVNKGKGMEPLSAEERKAIHAIMVKAGHLTKKELKKAVVDNTGALLGDNVDACFLVPRSEEALVLRPVTKEQIAKLKGRAPYSRSVLKDAVREIFSGKDPREEEGCLYLSEEIEKTQLQRGLDEKTNNHLIRHRVLIARRLIKDIIKTYAADDASRIGRITVEVNRDLRTFSGLGNEQKKKELGFRLADHTRAVKWLREGLIGTNYKITAGLIRKARVALDLDHRCPYTGQIYEAKNLVHGDEERNHVDKDHIIPRTLRPSDSLESLVITFSEVNKMKEDRTALEFIEAFQGKPVKGKPELTIFTKSQYLDFVKRLDERHGHDQDKSRKKKRKKLLELAKYTEKEFVPKDLTQTSHLVRVTAEELKKEFQDTNAPSIVSIPGSVTAEVRIGWNLYGCLAAHNPEVKELLLRKETEPELNIKKELRNITHLHHALDACVLGYASHFIPNDGSFWELLIKRNRRPNEDELLVQKGKGYFVRDGKGHARLHELRPDFKQRITEVLKECRVIQHIPKKMDGLAGLEENTRGLMAVEVPDGDGMKEIWNREDGVPLPRLENIKGTLVRLERYGNRDASGKRNREKTKEKNLAKLLGLQSSDGLSKLQAIKGIRIIEANFGLALWREGGKTGGKFQFRVIVWHKVWHQLKAIAENENGGKWPKILRAGQIVHIPNAGRRSDYRGYWKIKSAENQELRGITLKLSRVDSATGDKLAASVATLLESGMTVVKSGLTGVPLNL
jgi:hypothetical protein